MVKLQMHVLKGCPYCTRVIIAANATGAEIEYIYHHNYPTMKTPEYLALSPFGTAPLLITPEGPISESIPIMNYLARLHPESKLLGSTPFEQSQIEVWSGYAGRAGSIGGAFVRLINKKNMGPNDEAYHASKKAFVEKMQIYEERLADRKFIMGDNVTIADFAVIPSIGLAYALIFDEEARKQLPNVTRYFKDFVALEIYTKTFGKFRLCEEEFPRLTVEEWKALPETQAGSQ